MKKELSASPLEKKMILQLIRALYLPSKYTNMASVRWLFTFAIVIASFGATIGQENSSFYYFAQFTSKENSDALNEPLNFLTQKSLDRRAKSSIELNELDIPISAERLKAIEQIKTVKIHYPLKWSNGVVYSTPDSTLMPAVMALEFVDTVIKIKDKITGKRSDLLSPPIPIEYNYALAKDQIELINIPDLHAFSYNGFGLTIGVFDNGFRSVDTFPLFEHLWQKERIKGQYDMVDGDNNAIPHGGHGMSVLSCMGALSSDTMTGTAPEASYYLFRTEDNASETILEEYNWARAVEIADSIGIDIINSSLGYSLFDDTTTSHTYQDLDGNTTVVTKAANNAYRRGILVVNSAGNSGNRPWRYIIAPADGRYVLAIGATDSVGNIASFSSRGPNAAGLLKPNVSAVGARVVVGNAVGGADKSNGTSFSAPTIAGAAACLWQAFPEASNADIFRAIEASAHLYDTPDFDYGYGIPDFKKAFDILSNKHEPVIIDTDLIRDFNLYPNPTSNNLNLQFLELEETPISVSIHNYQGYKLLQSDIGVQKGTINLSINTSLLNSGYYILELKRGPYSQRKVFIKE